MISKRNLNVWILLIYIILSILLFDPKLFTGGDNARYIALAESLAKGKGYKEIYSPEESPYTLYPPGFPLLLVPIYTIFNCNILLLKLVSFLCGIGTFLFSFLIFKIIFKNKYLPPLLLNLFLPILITNNHWILSEIPYLCFSLGGIYFFLKSLEDKSPNIFFILCAIFSTYAFLIRSAGITLIGAITIFLLYKRQFKRAALFLLIFLAVFIPWSLRNASIPGAKTYEYWFLKKNPYLEESPQIGFNDLLRRVGYNVNLYIFTVFPLSILSGIISKEILAMAGLLLIALVIIGLIIRFKKVDFLDLYIIFSGIVIITWPEVWSSDRFLLPILPVLIIYIFLGLFWLETKIKSKYFVSVVTAIFIFVNLLEIIPQAKTSITNNIAYVNGDRYAGYTPDWRRYFETIEWIKINIPNDKIIIARKPEFVYLLSHHKSFCYPFTNNRDKIKESITKCDYILYDNFFWTGTTYRYLRPVLEENLENYELIFQTRRPEFYLLKIKK